LSVQVHFEIAKEKIKKEDEDEEKKGGDRMRKGK